MSDDSSSSSNQSQTSSWAMRGLKRWLNTAPETRDELIKLVQDSRQFLEPDTVEMLEGVLDLPATQIKEIMTPRPQVEGIYDNDSIETILSLILETNHSRYPIFDSQDDDAVIGILLAKDLIPLLVDLLQSESKPTGINLKSLMRQPLYINETSRSDILLRSLQRTQVHMAVVVDDFGNMVGVVTMEDLLEEIVGDIVDEHDNFDEDSDHNNIIPLGSEPNAWLVQASTPIEDCNDELNSAFDNTEVDTMGGLMMHDLGHVGDLQGQTAFIDGWQLTVREHEGRFIKTLEVRQLAHANHTL